VSSEQKKQEKEHRSEEQRSMAKGEERRLKSGILSLSPVIRPPLFGFQKALHSEL
jgi:hypothetical protein